MLYPKFVCVFFALFTLFGYTCRSCEEGRPFPTWQKVAYFLLIAFAFSGAFL